ncbi:hypothetical protein AMV049 [Betaentomopoxvirus amoorei]|uniref:AMV049 n=1 Tax=Amsacta moorei entomopoxvirus TaxID=28321 RepID=Q9EMZ9_AMEPV|nr:hypothetical protein AMV049 [Amsacta moorei entomopoxvirus]AAG02755.1 AMV049 [Amsacta moorei entomopoxvirus]
MLISRLKCKCGCNNYFNIDIDFIDYEDRKNIYLSYNLFYFNNYYILKSSYLVIYYNKKCINFTKYFKIYDHANNKLISFKWNNIKWIKLKIKYNKNIYIKYFDVYKKQELICLCDDCNYNFKIKYYINIIDNNEFYRLFFTLLVEYKYKICNNFTKYFKKIQNNNLINLYIDKVIWKPNIYYIHCGS